MSDNPVGVAGSGLQAPLTPPQHQAFQQFQGQFPGGFPPPQQFPPQFTAAHYAPASAAPQPQTPQNNAQAEQLRAFWQGQMVEVEQVSSDPSEFKNHQLPLARIKKIMKSDEDVRMISAEAPVLFAKACEMFILELTLRSWMHAEENKRRTLQRNDVAAAITRTDIFDFLVDIVPREDLKPENQEGGPVAPVGTTSLPAPAPAAAAPAAGSAPVPAQAPRPQAAPHPQAPMGMYYPYQMPPGTDPSSMLRPPLPMDPSQAALMYQQQFMGLAGQSWPPQMPNLGNQQGNPNHGGQSADAPNNQQQ